MKHFCFILPCLLFACTPRNDNAFLQEAEMSLLRSQVQSLQMRVDSLLAALADKPIQTRKLTAVNKKKGAKKTGPAITSLPLSSTSNYNWQSTATITPTYSGSGEKQTYSVRTGAICRDGTRSSATGRGACSHHGGVSEWLHN